MSHHPLGAESFFNAEKKPEDPETNKSAQCSVTCVYQAKVADLFRNVTVTWCKNLINHSLSITVENPSDENHYTCKVNLRTWQFWSKKGLKSFEVDEKRIDVFWDFRMAKFSSSPEPCSDYYVAVVSDEEVVLLLGDDKKEAYKRTKSRPSLVEATLVYKKENVFGKKCFCARAMLGEGKKEHQIVIENSVSGPGDPEMWISIDGIALLCIMNLHWRFRGNETVMLNNVPLEIFWDVHDWLFSSPGSGHGLFIFKPGATECAPANDRDGRNCSSENEGGRRYDSPRGRPSASEFCHFLYAWKIE